MLQTVLALCEKVGQLLKLKNERRRRFFKESIEPLHADMRVINKDYIDAFWQVRLQLPRAKGDNPSTLSVPGKAGVTMLETHRQMTNDDVQDLLEQIQSLKMKCDSLRNTVLTDVRVLPRFTKEAEEASYFQAVQDYFLPSSVDESTVVRKLKVHDLVDSIQTSLATDFQAANIFIESLSGEQLRAMILNQYINTKDSVCIAVDTILKTKPKKWHVVSKAYSALRARISQLD